MDRFGRRQAARAAVIVLITLGAAGISVAPASADVEPNNVISQAEGPIPGGVPIVGALPTGNDVDYYVFYAASQQQIHLTRADLTAPSSGCLEVGMSDTNGAGITDSYTTPPGVNRYFVGVSADDTDCGAISYRFEVGPAGAITGGPALDRALVQTSEPNETPGQAQGPLSAEVNYVGAHETANDQDWFYFYVPAGTHQLDISTTAPVARSCSSAVRLYGSASDDNWIDSASSGAFGFGHINQTVTGPAQYFLRAGPDDTYCLGDRWQFRIETPGAITASNPDAPPPKPPVATVSKYFTYLSLRRRGASYRGRVTSSRAGCKVGRLVVLRRNGSGTKRFGSAYSRGDGTFTIRRSQRLRGKVYVVAATRTSQSALCKHGRSSPIRG